MCVCVCVRACVRACVCVCVHARVCVHENIVSIRTVHKSTAIHILGTLYMYLMTWTINEDFLSFTDTCTRTCVPPHMDPIANCIPQPETPASAPLTLQCPFEPKPPAG